MCDVCHEMKEQGLLDIDYGEWQGLTPAEVAERYPELFRLWREKPHRVRIPGGESLRVVRRRATTALMRIVREHRGEHVALVGHQVVNKVLMCAVLGLSNASFWRIAQDNACINVFEYDGSGFNVLAVNDTSHLAREGCPWGEVF